MNDKFSERLTIDHYWDIERFLLCDRWQTSAQGSYTK